MLKTDIGSITFTTFDELKRVVDTFPIQCRNVKHSVREENTSKLCKRRIPHTNVGGLELAEVTYYHVNDL